MKKICFITPNVFPVPAVKGGAVETLVEELIYENEKYRKLDIECYSIYDDEAFEQSKKLKSTKMIFFKNKFYNDNFFCKCIDYCFIKLLKVAFNDYYYHKKICKDLKNKKFDYIIIEGGNPFGYKDLIKKVKKKKIAKQVYLHVHGVMQGTKKLNQLYDGFISISEFVSNQLTQNKFISNKKVHLVKNGIDIERFSQEITEYDKSFFRKKYNINQDDIVIMFSGRLVPEKGIKELILALKNIENLNKCKLIVVGNSQFANNAKSKFEIELTELGKQLENNIIFTGFIPNKEIYKLHRISDIFVVPSLCEEAFGLTLVEAMTAGLPIIATDSGAIPYIAKDGCAYILKRDEKLIDNITKTIDLLINNPEKRIKMAQIGKRLSKEYSLEALYTNFVQVLEEE